MPRLKADTRQAALDVALELFTAQGFEKTSLSEIAGRLGISKAALYYHFRSKNDLLRSLVAPLVEELDRFAENLPPEPRATLESYFDLCYRHRRIFIGMLNDIQVRNELDLVRTAIRWRTRIDEHLTGADPADRVRAVVALGGLQDTVILYLDHPDLAGTIRTRAVDAALRALAPA